MKWTLWGFHPDYKGADGYPYPTKLAVGSERDCNGEYARRKKQGWTTGRYRHGAEPTGLRLLCDQAYPNRSRMGES